MQLECSIGEALALLQNSHRFQQVSPRWVPETKRVRKKAQEMSLPSSTTVISYKCLTILSKITSMYTYLILQPLYCPA